MSEYHPTTKEKIIDAVWHNYYSLCAYLLIIGGLFVYDSWKVLLNLFTLDFILNPNHIVHMIWPWYVSMTLGISFMILFMRWIGPPPF